MVGCDGRVFLALVFRLHGGERTCRDRPGEKIGEGAFSEAHAWAPGRVVKLFKGGVPRTNICCGRDI
jgi:hypothetical protein